MESSRRLPWAVGSGEPARLQTRRAARSELGSYKKKLAGHLLKGETRGRELGGLK